MDKVAAFAAATAGLVMLATVIVPTVSAADRDLTGTVPAADITDTSTDPANEASASKDGGWDCPLTGNRAV